MSSDGMDASVAAGGDPTAHLRDILQWHFGADTGSPFWLRAATRWDFDPLTDIREPDDLRRFPDLSDELRNIAVDDLIPAGIVGEPFSVYESGGTSGAPKRIVEHSSRFDALGWVDSVLTDHGVPVGGHWLHIGPTGPHIVGRSMRRLAEVRGGTCFTVDFDPRWVKRLIADGRRALADEYVQHVLDQADLIVTSQRIGVIFATPPMLEALCARASLYDRLASGLGGVIWSGTSISPMTRQLLEEEYFPDIPVVGLYGNSMMGIAPQVPRTERDRFPCVFRTPQPQALVEVVNPDTGERSAVGERGRVLVHLLTRDMFLPNVLERDSAIRVGTPDGGFGDDVADVQPLLTDGQQVVEGVY
ncbi:hypothetical protein ABH920_003044 [Catenulispora sp. EB89]|uniref:phenazine biosynthesis protein n=1 Tax=Catenulispora sp. EB89 TaxID=3156257 RepID=UPI003512B364